MEKGALRKVAGYILIVTVVPYFISQMIQPISAPQFISLFIFISFIAGSLFYWSFRNVFALIGVALLLGFRVLDVEHLIEFASLDIVLFLVGMMTVIAFLEEKKFFDWFINVLIKPFAEKPPILIAVLLFLGAIMAALVDEVTSILFMTVIMMKVLHGYGIEGKKALPFIMFLVFTTNIGSSALPVGNPIGVLIAFKAGLTIADFIRWVFPLAMLNSIIVTLIGMVYLGRLAGFGGKHSNKPRPALELEKVEVTRDVKISIGLFVAVIAGLILHSKIEELLGLAKNQMLLGVPLFGAGVALLFGRTRAHELIAKVDWWTLLYFLLLFASVGTLAFTGVTGNIALVISRSAGNLFSTMLLVGGVISILTAFIDNVLAVATMIPVVQSLATTGINVEPIWWIMLIGGTYCGNATIIGSTANFVAAGLVEKMGVGQFSMVNWMIMGTAISVPTFLIAFALLWIQVGL